MSTEFPIFILGKNSFTSYGFSRPDNFEMKYRALQESVSFLNPFELENSHEGFGRTPLTMHDEASGTEVNAEGFGRTPLTMHDEASGTEVNAEGFSRTPLTMHQRASGTEVNAVFMNLEQPIQITPEVLENTSEGVMTDLHSSNHSSTENKMPRGVIHSIFNKNTRRKQ